jgi:polo-like kinase 1
LWVDADEKFNFYDHTKLILSRDGLVVSVIDKHYILRTWSLEALMRPIPEEVQGKERRRLEAVVHKLQYARWVQIWSYCVAFG